MSRWKPLAFTLIGALLIAAFVIAWKSGDPRSLDTLPIAEDSGPQIPNENQIIALATVNTLDGKKLPLKSFRGKWLLLNLWATWCGPCRMEMPDLQKVWSTQHKAGLEVLGISDEDPSDIWGFLNELPASNAIHYPIAVDTGSALRQALDAHAIPRNILVDPKGNVVFDSLGMLDYRIYLQLLSAHGFPVIQAR